MKHRCRYCSKVIDKSNRFCSDQCRKKYDEQERNDQRVIPFFLLGIIAGIVLVLAGSFMVSVFMMKGGVLICALTLMFWPLATPESIAALGYRYTRKIIRIVSLCLMLIILIK